VTVEPTAAAAGTWQLGDIPGTGDPRHLVENIAAGALRLTPDDLRLLDQGQKLAQG